MEAFGCEERERQRVGVEAQLGGCVFERYSGHVNLDHALAPGDRHTFHVSFVPTPPSCREPTLILSEQAARLPRLDEIPDHAGEVRSGVHDLAYRFGLGRWGDEARSQGGVHAPTAWHIFDRWFAWVMLYLICAIMCMSMSGVQNSRMLSSNTG